MWKKMLNEQIYLVLTAHFMLEMDFLLSVPNSIYVFNDDSTDIHRDLYVISYINIHAYTESNASILKLNMLKITFI